LGFLYLYTFMFKKLIPKIIGKLLECLSFFAPNKATKIAFDLFCKPRKGKAQPNHNEFFKTAIQKKINTNNHSIATYQWKGKGKTIFLLHGWESNSFRWRNLVELLKLQDYNIIAIDSPAQGNSSGKYLNVPLYTECVKDIAKIYKPEIIIGHSLGGMTSIYYQYKYQDENINKIVALGPPSELKLFLIVFQNTIGVSNKFMQKFEEFLFKKYGSYSKEFSIAKYARSLNCNGLLVLDKNDNLAPYKLSKRIANKWENCELMTVEGIGHSLQANQINDRILEFIKE